MFWRGRQRHGLFQIRFVVPRTAECMAKCVEPMLRCATRILFVDPYYRARYILTDIGGVEFGFGLDEGDRRATDDIMLLSAPAYGRRLGDYAGPAYGYRPSGRGQDCGSEIVSSGALRVKLAAAR